jgi:hypothetical protein
MKAATVSRLLRLYPECWRERYGEEFAALLEEHPHSPKAVLDTVWAAWEAHMNLRMDRRDPAALGGVIWSAWMAAVAAGIILYGIVDDSPFVEAFGTNALLGASWLGIEIGSVMAGLAVALAAAAVGWPLVRQALASHRRDILWRLALPGIAFAAVFVWIIAILIATGGRWAASPWAVSFEQPGWPSATFRWITGSVSAVLLLAALVVSAVSIIQALRLSQPALRHLRFAVRLAPVAAAGTMLMFVCTLLWGIAANSVAHDTLQQHLGPLGLTSLSGWFLSAVLFGASSIFSARAAWHSRSLQFHRG